MNTLTKLAATTITEVIPEVNPDGSLVTINTWHGDCNLAQATEVTMRCQRNPIPVVVGDYLRFDFKLGRGRNAEYLSLTFPATQKCDGLGMHRSYMSALHSLREFASRAVKNYSYNAWEFKCSVTLLDANKNKKIHIIDFK